MRYRFILALIAAVCSFALSPARAEIRVAQATTIAGSYSVVGTNPDGSNYSGTVVISQVGDSQYRFDWSIGNGQTFTGTGALDGTTISVDWGQDAPVIYQVSANGILAGTWANGHASEMLTPR